MGIHVFIRSPQTAGSLANENGWLDMSDVHLAGASHGNRRGLVPCFLSYGDPYRNLKKGASVSNIRDQNSLYREDGQKTRFEIFFSVRQDFSKIPYRDFNNLYRGDGQKTGFEIFLVPEKSWYQKKSWYRKKILVPEILNRVWVGSHF